MENITVVSSNKEKVFYSLIVLYILFATDSMLFKLNNNAIAVAFAKNSVIFFLLLLVFYTFSNNIKLNKNELLITIMFITSLVISMIITKDFTGAYFFKSILILIAMFFSRIVDIDKFVSTFIDIMKYIALVSLVAMLFQDIITKVGFLPEITTPRGHTFTSLGITNLPHYDSYKFRNWGPFWEPGVYQAYLNLSLFFVIHWRNRMDKDELYKIILFSLTIITTLSTSGIIAMVFLLTSLFFKRTRDLKIISKFVLLTIFTVSALYILYDDQLRMIIFGKLSSEAAGNVTFMSRWYSVTGIFRIFMENPFIGVGPNNVLLELTNYANQEISVTNTITFHFASFGIIIGIIYLVWTYKLVTAFKNNIWITIALLFWLSIILMSQNYTYSLLFNILIFMNWRNSKNQDLKGRLE